MSTTNTERVHRWLEGLETITAPHSRAAESVAGRAASGSKGQSDNVTVKGVEASDRSAAKEARSTDRGPESYPPDRSRPVLHSALRPDAQPFHPQGYATHPPGASGIQPREALLRSIRAAAANGTGTPKLLSCPCPDAVRHNDLPWAMISRLLPFKAFHVLAICTSVGLWLRIETGEVV